MPSRRIAEPLRHTQALFGAGSMVGVDDDELLRRFAARCEEGAEAAFAVLVARYGPLVLGVCRRLLADEHAAEDAFQATFLVLAHRASGVRGATLGPWLYGVARRVARKARADAQRHRYAAPASLALVADGAADAAVSAERRERAAVLDEELARLPARARAPLVLCDLGGLTHEQAAARLGCPVGTLKSRQARARRRLRSRLARRGLAPALAAGACESLTYAAAAPPPRLVRATVEVVHWFATHGLTPPAGTVPAGVAAVAESIVGAMMMTKLKWAGVLTVLGLSAALGAAVVRGQDGLASDSATPAVKGARATPTVAPRADPSRPLNAAPGDLVVAGQPDRMRALEDKLDRLLRVLEQASAGPLKPERTLGIDTGQNFVPDPPPVPDPNTAPPGAARVPSPPAGAPALIPTTRDGSAMSLAQRVADLERRQARLERKFDELMSRLAPVGNRGTPDAHPSTLEPAPSALADPVRDR